MNQYPNNYQYNATSNYNTQNQIPPQYKPLGAWAYFGYSILFTLPIIGFICLIVFSVSDANINRRNYARSYWCLLAIVAIIVGIIILISVIGGISIGGLDALSKLLK